MCALAGAPNWPPAMFWSVRASADGGVSSCPRGIGPASDRGHPWFLTLRAERWTILRFLFRRFWALASCGVFGIGRRYTVEICNAFRWAFRSKGQIFGEAVLATRNPRPRRGGARRSPAYQAMSGDVGLEPQGQKLSKFGPSCGHCFFLVFTSLLQIGGLPPAQLVALREQFGHFTGISKIASLRDVILDSFRKDYWLAHPSFLDRKIHHACM